MKKLAAGEPMGPVVVKNFPLAIVCAGTDGIREGRRREGRAPGGMTISRNEMRVVWTIRIWEKKQRPWK